MSVPFRNQLTCLVPTYNRPAFLRRLLLFMAEQNEDSRIQIFDSSDSSCRVENRKTCEVFRGRLFLEYRHVDDLDVMEKFLQALEHVSTPLVSFCADDDFLIPDTLRRCAEHMREKPEYSCAGGVILKVRGSPGIGKKDCVLCRGFDLPHESAMKRFRLLGENWYSTFYFVHRTDILRESFRLTTQRCSFYRARVYPELLLAQLSVLTGKVKFFPKLHQIRQMHDLNYGRRPIVRDQQHALQHHQAFRQTLAEQIVEHTELAMHGALSLVDQYYGHILRPGTKRGTMTRIRREIARGVRKLVDRFRRDSFLERRPLRKQHPFRRDPAWQLGYYLLTKYPAGLSECELTKEISGQSGWARRVA